MDCELRIEPPCRQWAECLATQPTGRLLGRRTGYWRERTRSELGLPTDRPIIATGHQTLLWHPGILVKYMLADIVAEAVCAGVANLIVDQHVGGFGEYEVPVRRSDGTLAVRRVELTSEPAEVPMGLHPAFAPPPPLRHLRPALPSVEQGIRRIHDAIAAHRDAPNAAQQMAGALNRLMGRWVRPTTAVTAGDLIESTLSRAMLKRMAREPQRCAAAYNVALASMPEAAAGIRPLLIRDDYVELPVWRLRPDGRRMHGYDNDVQMWLDDPASAPRLMPRALYMTALVRLGMCDLFVHGTGGGRYDRVMERWIGEWLGAEAQPIAVATATLRLPLREADEESLDAARETLAARRVWHDPEPPEPPEAPDGDRQPGPSECGARPGPVKRELLDAVDQAPRRSARRRAAFYAMHRELGVLRGVHGGRVEQAQRRAAEARRQAADAAIANRRDWAFPLYPDAMLDGLADAVARAAGARPAEEPVLP